MDLSRKQKITMEESFDWHTRQIVNETLKIIGIPKKNLSVNVRQELVKLVKHVSGNLYTHIEHSVRDSNKIISTLRGAIRKMMRWEIRKIHYGADKNFALLSVDEKRKLDKQVNSMKFGMEKARDEIMSLSKKILQGHDIKFFHQDKSCLKCKQPVDEGTGIDSRRGVICDECDPDFKPKEDYTAESSQPRKIPVHYLKKSFDKGQ